ncbi:hypothetical protein [Candidatus Coxiella mudrowiae]|uniref:hypothetical protein n=1 Tax=Candidatus Coxiella mudrowiae TaxID=2054173 RepID=UPI000AD18EF1|nr:hypothetical protein [Candidatus Coxiella mudrowiae]
MNKVTILYKIKSLRKTSNDFICEVVICEVDITAEKIINNIIKNSYLERNPL